MEVSMLYAVNFKDREEVSVESYGAKKTYVRWLVGKNTGARTYAMRHIEIKPGGIIPLHTHPEEHQIFVLQGEAKMLGDSGQIAKKDDAVFVPPNAEHGYDNTDGSESFRFICVIPLLEK
jgi:quercetin dioxygenase-like cupin family protein